MLLPGPTLVLGACEVALLAARDHDVVVIDWNRRRLNRLGDFARERGLRFDLVCRDPDRQDLGVPDRYMSNVVCLDTLERLRDDVAVLERIHRSIEPEGRLVVRVRAQPWTRETTEAIRGPVRAYDSESLRERLTESGFRTLQLRHWNLFGVPATILGNRVADRSTRGENALPSFERPRHWWESAADYWFRIVENHVGFPTGVSLVAVATPHLERVRVRTAVMERSLPRSSGREAYDPMPTSR
jgi:SAM-dependent methyltransferase